MIVKLPNAKVVTFEYEQTISMVLFNSNAGGAHIKSFEK